jgi:branched-chain amino acid transport system substrate-binding protein
VPTIRRRRLLLGAGIAGLTAERARDAAAPLPLGALFPFSGPLSLLGDESFRGLDLAADERNAAGGLLGRRIALVRGDAADGTQGTAEAKRLLGAAHCPAIFGTFSSTVALTASAEAELAGMPYFELDALADALTDRGFKLLFRTGTIAAACGDMAIDTVADLLAPSWDSVPARLHLAILHQDGTAGTAIAAAAQARAHARGFTQVDVIAYAASILDLTPIVQRLRGAGADVVLHSGLMNDVLLFHRALAQANWRPRMVIGVGAAYALTDTAQALGAAIEGVLAVGVTPYRISVVVAPGAAHVAAAYQRKYGAPPRSGHSLVCYAGARALFDAIERAGTLDRDRLRAALLATDVPDGATAAGWGVAFDARGQNRRARPFLAQWRGGALLTVSPLPASVATLRPRLGA